MMQREENTVMVTWAKYGARLGVRRHLPIQHDAIIVAAESFDETLM